MAGNQALGNAAKAKKDEFYTQIQDIEKEMRFYRRHFKGKTVLCNCDDPYESKFFEYFVKKFNALGLKKLIATCYAGSPIMGQQFELFDVIPDAPPGTPYKAVVTKVYDKTGDGYFDMDDVKALFLSGENLLTKLQGDGDFRSQECLDILDEADIVVTNPPFSLFREYVAVLMEHKKDFIILGNQNAITFTDFFPLLMKNKVWLGASIHSGDRAFWVPDDYPLEAAGCGIDEKTGRKFIRVKGVRWYTTLDHRQRHEGLDLYRKYTPELYPTYDNYDAIEVSSTSDIPCDFPGVMGVPITFLDKYSPEQFEILGMTDRNNRYGLTTKIYTKEDGDNYGDCNRRGAIRQPDGTLKSTYARLLVRNLNPEGKN